jgi:hypothetical protein
MEVSGQLHAPDTLTLKKDPLVPIAQKDFWNRYNLPIWRQAMV